MWVKIWSFVRVYVYVQRPKGSQFIGRPGRSTRNHPRDRAPVHPRPRRRRRRRLASPAERIAGNCAAAPVCVTV